jgi:hypothetical protein
VALVLVAIHSLDWAAALVAVVVVTLVVQVMLVHILQ